MGWKQFLKIHWEVLAAMDFFTVEVVTWHGLVTYEILLVMELATRRVQVAGSRYTTLWWKSGGRLPMPIPVAWQGCCNATGRDMPTALGAR
jgi:hypothetical protein